MSAIAGIVRFDGRPDAASDLARMMRSLAALGPDRQSHWDGGSVALGFRQMALLPEDVADRQPWRAREGSRVLIADARLDNREELGDALGIDPPQARAMADSELLLRAYEAWDLACLDRLVGDFAFALWDAREHRLVCARCHVNGPPIFYHRSEWFFAFATSPTALFALPEVPRELGERRLALQLAVLPRQTGDTYFRDVFCLPAAHHLVVSDGKVTVARYWQLDPGRRIRLGSDDAYAEALRERFDLAVRARLRSRHPIGSLLSSGCDSSAVTVTAARMLSDEHRTLIAYTAAPREGYPAAESDVVTDESPAAAQLVASLPNVRHQIIRRRGHTPLDGLDHANLIFGRPLHGPANYVWVSDIFDAARQTGVRVLLDGGHGNYSISYDGLPRLAELLRSGRWHALAREALALRRQGLSPGRILEASLAPHLPPELWSRWRRHRTGTGRAATDMSAANPAFIAAMDGERATHHSLRAPADGFAWRRTMLAFDEQGENRNASLAGWGIELRDPTADRRVLEFCLAIPEEQYLRDGETRRLYRRAFADRLPAAEIAARPRGYQAADWHEGLNEAKDQIVAELGRMEKSPGARRALDLPRLRRLVEDWPTGHWHRRDVVANYRVMLLRAVAVGKFIRWVEGGNE